MTYVLFAGDEDTAPLQIQQATYVSTWDFETYPGPWNIAIGNADHKGDDVFDLTNPESPKADAGVYTMSAVFGWNQAETGAAVQGLLNVYNTGAPYAAGFQADLGVVPPAGSSYSDGGVATVSAIGLLAEDAQPILDANITHNRATDNLTGALYLTVVRLY